MASTNTNPSKTKTTIDIVGGIYCKICSKTYGNKKDYDSHYQEHSKDIEYTCVVCHKDISGYASFRGHCYTSHVIKNRFKCEQCSKTFSKMSALKDHINLIHQNQCTTCNKKFSTKKELHLHKIIHRSNDGPPFQCQECKINLDSLDACKTHVDVHLTFTYSCPICEEIIPQKEFATDHLKQHFGNVTSEQVIYETINSANTALEKLGGISCYFCTMILPTRSEFDAHFLYEHGDEDILYTCVVCGKPFDKYSSFSEHVYNHFTKGRFACDLCPKSFPRLSLLVTHISVCANSEDGNNEPFVCIHCNKCYATEQRLDYHLQNAHKQQNLKCPEPGCDKIFDKCHKFILHQRHHNTNMQNWCRQCGMLFTSLVSCVKHLDIHKKKHFICPVCNRHFAEKYMITPHLPQHFETTLHICNICGKVYNAKFRLIQHMKTHAEKKGYKCNYCPISFTNSANLEQHMHIHTGVKQYHCDICVKSFTSYPNFYKHMNKIHKILLKKTTAAKNMPIGENTNENLNENNNLIQDLNVCIQSNHIDSQNHDLNLNQSRVDNNNELDLGPVNFDAENGENLSAHILYEPDPDCLDDTHINAKESLFDTVMDDQYKSIETNSTQIDYISTTAVEPIEISSKIPPEYGPEFSSNIDGTSIICLDDHVLPHIDPLLPHLDPLMVKNGIDMNDPFNITDEKWEPPIITMFYPDYHGYEMSETNNIASMINADIF
ncbi:zinc finger protein 569-like [Leptidea sinapis]|uniref:zinc finger protein 569-like n=1 Tax=Leptidea sinapis TaxID=189913 RepID=UPI0021C3E88B|nr:zinc finger protein 569-like [Leptidea sinapis]